MKAIFLFAAISFATLIARIPANAAVGWLDGDGILRRHHSSEPVTVGTLRKAKRACPAGTRLPTTMELADFFITKGARGFLKDIAELQSPELKDFNFIPVRDTSNDPKNLYKNSELGQWYSGHFLFSLRGYVPPKDLDANYIDFPGFATSTLARHLSRFGIRGTTEDCFYQSFINSFRCVSTVNASTAVMCVGTPDPELSTAIPPKGEAYILGPIKLPEGSFLWVTYSRISWCEDKTAESCAKLVVATHDGQVVRKKDFVAKGPENRETDPSWTVTSFQEMELRGDELVALRYGGTCRNTVLDAKTLEVKSDSRCTPDQFRELDYVDGANPAPPVDSITLRQMPPAERHLVDPNTN